MEYKPLNKTTWIDFEQLFGKHKGVRGGCWCVYHRIPASLYNKTTRDERYTLQKSFVDDEQATGILLYESNTPIGWCNVGKAEYFVQFDRSVAYQQFKQTDSTKPNWRIACVFVDKHHRKKGLSAQALACAIDYIQSQGGGLVEAFPLHLTNQDKPQYTGTLNQYLELGFEIITRLGKNRVLVRKQIKTSG
jgi:GNAT superfamily N-acetyltransferase